MKKRLVSIILTVFLVLSMVPFAAFADNAIVCPACGGEVIKKPYHLVGNYWDFYKCNTCGKWAYLSGVAGLKLLSAGDQAIINAADANAILNFSFNNGHLIPAEKAPSGIGRKDLPGYNDDNGTPTIGADGFPTLTFKMLLNGFSTSFGGTFLYGSPIGSYSNGTYSVSSIYNFTGFYATDNATNYPSGCVSYYFDAPYTGYYQVTDAPCSVEILSKNYYDNTFSDDNYAGMVQMSYDFTYSKPSLPSRFYDSMKNGESGNFKSGKVYIVKGQRYFFNFYLETYYQLSNSSSSFPSYYSVSIDFPAPTITVTDIGSIATINKQTNITINNNTWNGNIYTDNSTNLTYIYPQYTTINEKNETVTNISTNPIIYNNETKQYYTYDSVTNNYYYITYENHPDAYAVTLSRSRPYMDTGRRCNSRRRRWSPSVRH